MSLWLFYAAVYWGSKLRVADTDRLNKMIHKYHWSRARLSDGSVREEDAV